MPRTHRNGDAKLARRLNVRGRSSMTKAQLVEAIHKANDRETEASRGT